MCGFFSVFNRSRKYAPSSADRPDRSSSTMTRKAAIAIAQPSGLPPNVLPWSPGVNTSITSLRETNADTG